MTLSSRWFLKFTPNGIAVWASAEFGTITCQNAENMNKAQNTQITDETAVAYDRRLAAVFSFALEREQINPFVKPTNKHGNNGGVGMSGRMPTRWKAIKFIDNATQEQALKQFSCYKEAGFRIVNYDTGECIYDGGSRF